jgi:ankyrin repeat protein
MDKTDPSNSVDSEAKQLIGLCRAGRLYEIEKWINEGKSLKIPAATKRGKQRSLLEIAVETRFHSLVELIAKHEASQSAMNHALCEAVSSRRLDLVELLLANGADIRSVPLADVLLTWEPTLIRFFLDHGADPSEGRPFAEAFGARVRTALRPFVEYKRSHPELAAALQEQLDCALRHFCGEGDLKWVSLLIWAGGDPRSRGPCLEKEYTEDSECHTSGLEEACRSETLDALKKLKPDPSRDNLTELLGWAAIWCRKETLEYLLEIGANPNDKAIGGSSALDTVLREFRVNRFDPFNWKRLKSKYDVSRSFDCVRVLLAHGAIWNHGESYDLNCLRRALLECEPDVTIDLLKLFREHNVCPAAQVHKLLGTPRMKDHLKPAMNALLRLGIHLDVGRNASRPGQRSRAQYSR